MADTTLKEARFVPILDLELGIGWEGCGGHVGGSVGYLAIAWLNTTKASTFIAGVQANDYSGLDRMFDNTLAFDGFLVRWNSPGRLNAQVVKRRTPWRLAERDPSGEVQSWRTTMASLIGR